MDLIKSWKDVKVGTYERMLAADLNQDDPDGIYKLVAVIYNISLEEIMELPLQETAALIKSVEPLQRRPKNVLVKPEYKLGDTVYEFKSEAQDITTAQYIDFNNTTKDPAHMAELLAVFLIPKGKKYNKGYDFKKAVEDVRNYLSVPEALSMSDFFMFRWRQLVQVAVKKAKTALKQARKDGAITKEEQKETAEKLDKLADTFGSTI